MCDDESYSHLAVAVSEWFTTIVRAPEASRFGGPIFDCRSTANCTFSQYVQQLVGDKKARVRSKAGQPESPSG